MPYTANDAQQNMESLIDGLQTKYDQLMRYQFRPELSPTEKDIIRNEAAKVLIEKHHKSLLAAFDAASTEVIRPPSDAEVAALENTLTDLGRELDSLANFQTVVKFVEDVMTENAQRFNEILQTIDL